VLRAAAPSSSASAAYAAQASASSPAAPAFADPLSAAAASPRAKNGAVADPLGATKPAKDAVFDPLRAMASEQKKAVAAESSHASNVASAVSSPRSISKIESVSVGEVKADLSVGAGSSSVIFGAVRSSVGPTGDSYEPWRDKRAAILTKFTTNKRIPVQANFLEEEKVAPPKAVDSAKSRLEELEQEAAAAGAAAAAAAEGGVPGAVAALSPAGKINMSQKEYISHIEEQHERLKQAWESGERVLSLKIAIQVCCADNWRRRDASTRDLPSLRAEVCSARLAGGQQQRQQQRQPQSSTHTHTEESSVCGCVCACLASSRAYFLCVFVCCCLLCCSSSQCAKLLGDSSVPQFYPSMYVLLTDILDTFGDLVFERIKRKGVDVLNAQTKVKTAASLPVNFVHTDVSASAQETCRNWFYKTACQPTLPHTRDHARCLLLFSATS
jgi:hypothetical protein